MVCDWLVGCLNTHTLLSVAIDVRKIFIKSLRNPLPAVGCSWSDCTVLKYVIRSRVVENIHNIWHVCSSKCFNYTKGWPPITNNIHLTWRCSLQLCLSFIGGNRLAINKNSELSPWLLVFLNVVLLLLGMYLRHNQLLYCVWSCLTTYFHS